MKSNCSCQPAQAIFFLANTPCNKFFPWRYFGIILLKCIYMLKCGFHINYFAQNSPDTALSIMRPVNISPDFYQVTGNEKSYNIKSAFEIFPILNFQNQ